MLPFHVHEALVGVCAAATVQLAFVSDPLKVPLVQVRVSEMHWLPAATELVWYAVTEALLATVDPLKEQDAAEPTEHEGAAYEPLKVPFVQVLACEAQVEPYATDDD